MPQLPAALLSWRWAPTWAAPFPFVWVGLVAVEVADGRFSNREVLPETLLLVLGLSIYAALPFAALGVLSAQVRVEVIKPCVIGGLVAGALAWLPFNASLVRSTLGLPPGSWTGMFAMYLAVSSPFVVGIGFGLEPVSNSVG